jgi:ketopantoate reductase
MRALVVGAGVVGQVYGRHLRAGGAEVSYLVKPAHAARARGGFTLYALNRRRDRRAIPERVDGFPVLTGAAEVRHQQWDQVYLTVSSTALRAGGWFAELAPAIGSATLVLLQPGPDDRAFVLQQLPAGHVVQGIITLVGYHAPLPGETHFPEPGVAYWFPPLASSPMSGPAARLAPVLAALRAGGLRARRLRDVSQLALFPTALAMPLLAALEQAGWSFDQLRRSDRLGQAWRAGRQAMAVTARRERRRPPLLLRLLSHPLVHPLLLRAGLRLAPLVLPMDLEAYVRAHFTKVGDQTRDFLRGYLHQGRAAGLPVDGLTVIGPGAG